MGIKRTLNEGNLSEWVNKETGEVRYVREVDLKMTDKDFDKVWIALLMATLGIIGNKKIEVLRYLVENRNSSDNVVFATQYKISENIDVSLKTINGTISELKKAKLISQVCPGAYRLNPGIIWRGSHMGRMAIMAKFSEETSSKEPKSPEEVQSPSTEEKTLRKAPRGLKTPKKKTDEQAVFPGVTLPESASTGTEG